MFAIHLLTPCAHRIYIVSRSNNNNNIQYTQKCRGTRAFDQTQTPCCTVQYIERHRHEANQSNVINRIVLCRVCVCVYKVEKQFLLFVGENGNHTSSGVELIKNGTKIKGSSLFGCGKTVAMSSDGIETTQMWHGLIDSGRL